MGRRSRARSVRAHVHRGGRHVHAQLAAQLLLASSSAGCPPYPCEHRLHAAAGAGERLARGDVREGRRTAQSVRASLREERARLAHQRHLEGSGAESRSRRAARVRAEGKGLGGRPPPLRAGNAPGGTFRRLPGCALPDAGHVGGGQAAARGRTLAGRAVPSSGAGGARHLYARLCAGAGRGGRPADGLRERLPALHGDPRVRRGVRAVALPSDAAEDVRRRSHDLLELQPLARLLARRRHEEAGAERVGADRARRAAERRHAARGDAGEHVRDAVRAASGRIGERRARHAGRAARPRRRRLRLGGKGARRDVRRAAESRAGGSRVPFAAPRAGGCAGRAAQVLRRSAGRATLRCARPLRGLGNVRATRPLRVRRGRRGERAVRPRWRRAGDDARHAFARGAAGLPQQQVRGERGVFPARRAVDPRAVRHRRRRTLRAARDGARQQHPLGLRRCGRERHLGHGRREPSLHLAARAGPFHRGCAYRTARGSGGACCRGRTGTVEAVRLGGGGASATRGRPRCIRDGAGEPSRVPAEAAFHRDVACAACGGHRRFLSGR